MLKDPSAYNAKLEQKYFYLPKICRKGTKTSKEIFKSLSVSLTHIIPSYNQIERTHFR